MVPIGGVNIADVIGRILEGSVADAPLHPGKGRNARAAQFDLRGAEEGHWKITAQSYPVTLVAEQCPSRPGRSDPAHPCPGPSGRPNGRSGGTVSRLERSDDKCNSR